MSRPTLAELRQTVLEQLGHDWQTPTEIGARLGLDHGPSYYRLALTLERLANDGLAELKTPGSTVRRFRRIARNEGKAAFLGSPSGYPVPRHSRRKVREYRGERA